MTPPVDPTYVAAVLALYLDLPDTPLQPSALDHWLARRLQEKAVPLALVESALLLASLRRLVRAADVPPLPPIRSLAYFQPVIAELQHQPPPDHYLHYLRAKLRKALSPPSAAAQKYTFSDDR